jgi:hypothetical protein
MIYMAASTQDGILVSLAIDDENLNRIKADDPLMARLSRCGYSNGLFFLYLMSPEGGLSPRMQQIVEELKGLPVKLKVCALGLGATELEDLKVGKFVKIQPGNDMPGIFQIAVFYNSDQGKMLDKLREAGLIGPDTRIEIDPRVVRETGTMGPAEMVIGCVPCVDGMKLNYVPYKNSTVAKCSLCEKEVWLGPKQKEAHEKQHYPIVCLNCIAKEHGAEAADWIIPLTEKKTGE